MIRLNRLSKMGQTRDLVHRPGSSGDLRPDQRGGAPHRRGLLFYQSALVAIVLVGTAGAHGDFDRERAAAAGVAGSEDATGAPLETSKWNIPERLRIGPDRPYGSLGASDRACALCLKRWQAIDIARTFLEKYPLSHLNLRAELLSDYRWDGDRGRPLRRTKSEWYFGYRVGLPPDPYGYHRMSVRELQLRGLLNPDGSPREDDRRTASVHQTWRVWYQTGWVEPEELASLVQRGELPEEALGWGRQPLEEFILVHARTGAIEPVKTGRGNERYFYGVVLHGTTNREHYEINHRWNRAINWAMKRAEPWIERPIPMKKSSPAPEGNAKHPKDELFHGYTAQNPTPAEQDPSSSIQISKSMFIGECEESNDLQAAPWHDDCNSELMDVFGDCVGNQDLCHRNGDLLNILDTVSDAWEMQLEGASGRGGAQYHHAQIKVQAAEFTTDPPIISARYHLRERQSSSWNRSRQSLSL